LSFSLNPDGSFSYTPAANFRGVDSFTYSAHDGENDSNAAMVTIAIPAVNDAPLAENDHYMLPEEGVLSATTPGVLDNDGDIDGATLTVELVSPPRYAATFELDADGSFAYAAAANFNGVDTFTYRVGNGIAYSNIAMVQIAVANVNDGPFAQSQSVTLNENTSANIVLGATDIDSTSLSFSVLNGPSHGTVLPNSGTMSCITEAQGTTCTADIGYVPFANYHGPDNFTFAVADGFAVSNTATVSMTVLHVNRPPSANAGGPYAGVTGAPIQFSGLASDPDGDALTFAWDFGDGGTASVQNPAHVYTAPGTFTVTLTVSDPFGGAAAAHTTVPVAASQVLPPDPVMVAPRIDNTAATDMALATEFLYTGENPIQRDVAPGTIEPKRAAVLRGKIFTRDGNALSGVKITILKHLEFGSTLSRSDGMFDIAVNGGAPVTVNYDKPGFLPAQRQVQVPWRDYVLLPDVVLIPLDAQVTTVDLASTVPIQVARGSRMADSEGSRQATLLFRQGTQAELVLANGSTQSLTTLSLRATEFTVGPSGAAAMPGALPPTSGYTYAAEFTADEALTVGAKEVRFSQPVISYTENFLNFPVGGIVPAGFYDREKAAWIPSENGRVVKIIDVTSGVANLDINGDGFADSAAALSALGITDAERQQIASLYNPGQSLWRVPVAHFTPWDYNWPYGPPADAMSPSQPALETVPENRQALDDPKCGSGSIIECQNQILGEWIDITGTQLKLHYQSDRVPGRKAAGKLSLAIPLSGSNVPASLRRIELEVVVAGRKFTQVFSSAPNQSYLFTWDGKDVYERRLQGTQPVTVRLGYVYNAVYQQPAQFAQSFAALSGVPFTGIRARQEITIWQEQRSTLSAWDVLGQGLGGWTLNLQHSYDPSGRVLYLGDGSRRSAQDVGTVITTVAGNGVAGYSGDGGSATKASINSPSGVTVDKYGNLYIVDDGNHRIRKVRPDGTISTVAGNGAAGYSGDGGPATNAQLAGHINRLATDLDGNLHIFDEWNNRVRKVSSDGVIRTVAGDGRWCSTGDGGPATSACLATPTGGMFDAQGNLFISEWAGYRVRKVAPDGTITTAAGNGIQGYSGDGGPASLANLSNVWEVVVDPQGNLLIADHGNLRVRKVTPTGIISTIAGGGFSLADNVPATSASFNAGYGGIPGIGVDGEGNLYILDRGMGRVRKVNGDGLITTVTGNGTPGYSGDGGPAQSAQINIGVWGDIFIDGDGNLYIADQNNHRIRKVSSLFPGFTGQDLTVPSSDGRELYAFDSRGRHLRTIDSLTGTIRYQFAHDSAGYLTAITDVNGNVTLIERDGNGRPTAIVASGGQRTSLTLDSGGYLAGVTDPAGNTIQFAYDSGALLTAMRDARGGLHQYGYDSRGRLVRDEDPAGGFSQLSRVNTANGYEVALTTSLGRTSRYSVDHLSTGGTRRVDTDPSGITTMMVTTPDGARTTTSSNGTTATVRTGPDPRFGMQAPIVSSVRVASPSGRVSLTTTTRSVTLANPNNLLSLSSLTDTTISNGRTFTSVYNANQRTFTNISPLGRQRFTILDGRSRVVSHQIAGLAATNFTYDAQGRLTAIAKGSGATARTRTMSYDAQNRVSAITDPTGRTTTFIYDLADRVSVEILPDGREIRYTYDPNGNVTSITPPGRPAHAFQFTPVDLENVYSPPGAGLPGPNTTYSYNTDKQLTQALRPDGQTIDLHYDNGGRLITMTLSQGQIVYSYQSTSGNLASIAAPGGQNISYGYDGALLTSVTWGGSVAGYVAFAYNNDSRVTSETINGGNAVNFTYDDDGLLTQAGALSLNRNGQNGLLAGSTVGNVADTITYNTFAEPVSYRAAYGTGVLVDVQYTRDALGRITQKIETVQGVSDTFDYGYDTAGRLTEVKKNGAVTSTYGYDSNSNRLTVTASAGTLNATYDDQDRLLSYGTAVYAYSPNGELFTKTAGGQTTTYGYDALGNLRSVILPGGSRIDYTVDGTNRRIGKKVNGVAVQGFLYQDQLRIIAELDGTGNVVSRFVYGSRVNVPDYMTKGGATYRIIADHLGSPRLVVNTATGVVVQRIDYDEFGQIILDTNPGFQPFGFAGGLYDQHTTLVRFGARDYDPEIGRWTSKDPIRFAGGDTNLYGYAVNNPLSYFDRDGQIILEATLTFIGVQAVTLAATYAITRGVAAMNNAVNAANCDPRRIDSGDINNAFKYAAGAALAPAIPLAAIEGGALLLPPAANAVTNYVYRNPDHVQNIAEFIDGVLPTPPGGGAYEFIGEMVNRVVDRLLQ
jgi:RHS repeat-associated protein